MSAWTGRKPPAGLPIQFDAGYAEERGLVGAWLMDTIAPRDISGVGNHVQRTGVPNRVFSTPHGAGTRFYDHGGTFRLDLGDIEAGNPLNLSEGSRTADECTVLFRTLNASGNSFPFIFGKGTGLNGAGGYALYGQGTAVAFGKEGSVGTSASGLLSTTEWRNVAMTFDAGRAVELAWFNDGVEHSTGNHAQANTFETTTAGANIGHSPWSSGGAVPYIGWLDYLQIFNTVLPDSEILRIARAPYRHITALRRRVFSLAPAAAPSTGAAGPLVNGGLVGRTLVNGGLAA